MKYLKGKKSQQSEESKRIEAFLEKEKKLFNEQKNDPKLLILGSSDSGKSTLLKQMKILHGNGFNKQEREAAIVHIRRNLFDCAVFFIDSVGGDILNTSELKNFANTWDPQIAIPENIISDYTTLWSNPKIKELVEHSKTLPCTIEYFLNDLTRFMKPDYTPTNEDILNLRVTTLAISATTFLVDKHRVHFFDVSGLKYHRTSWLSYFDKVDAILFVSDLSGYDQTLLEDSKTNRMEDSISLFGIICSNKLLEHAGFILFLNKKDIFKKKVKQSPIKDYFPAYKGDDSSKQGGNFFQTQFIEVAGQKKSQVTAHFTCCTDTNSMAKLMDDLLDRRKFATLMGFWKRKKETNDNQIEPAADHKEETTVTSPSTWQEETTVTIPTARQDNFGQISVKSSPYESIGTEISADDDIMTPSYYRSLNLDLGVESAQTRLSLLSMGSSNGKNDFNLTKMQRKATRMPLVSPYRSIAQTTLESQSHHLKLRENLEWIIKVNRLERFYPDSSIRSVLERLRIVDFERLTSNWGIHTEIVEDLAALALYDIVVLVDDSKSMHVDDYERKKETEMIISRIAEVTALFDDDGIMVRFINSSVEGLGIKTQNQVHALLDQIQNGGTSPIGTALEEKVIEPFVYDAIREKVFKKPVLVYIVTVGVPSGEDRLKIFNTIHKCKHNLVKLKYGKAVAFEFAQIGKDAAAQKFLNRLDVDVQFGDVVGTTSYYGLEAEECFKNGVNLTPDFWLLKLMLGAVDPSYGKQDAI